MRCRECDLLVRRAAQTCPSCGARRPVLLTAVAPRPVREVAVPRRVGVAGAVLAAPVLLGLDQALRWLLTA